jgi:hypothetical protein
MRAAGIPGSTPAGIASRKSDPRASRGCPDSVGWATRLVRLMGSLKSDLQPPIGEAGCR